MKSARCGSMTLEMTHIGAVRYDLDRSDVTAVRGHGLLTCVQPIELDFRSIEKKKMNFTLKVVGNLVVTYDAIEGYVDFSFDLNDCSDSR
ncbi:hypothetical protein L1987_02863 [Smallanthus sonchifolius]|uniref:Uncharacterized protein n=1 Tax=Smallanthus sonchifolius TaxID=185202 RepID=A0ACB9K921_9ASTR|nr:hypothetical protein L1987_02863 [Smallanthus sonchifolius]